MPLDANIPNAMENNAQINLAAALNPELGTAARLNAIRNLRSGSAISGFQAILPTTGDDEVFEITQGLCATTMALLERTAGALAEIVQQGGDDELVAEALTTLNQVELLQEVIPGLAADLADFEVDQRRGRVRGRQRPHEDGLEDPADRDVQYGQAIRAPLVVFPPHRACREEAFSVAVPCGGCAVTVKEFRGMQLRRSLRCMRKWVEPWYARRRLITKYVWVLEWVPVQFIKTITVRCGCESPGTHVDKRVILDRGLMNHWHCY